MLRRVIAILFIITVTAPLTRAHYLWVIVDGSAAGQNAAKVYFEEGPGPGDGHYLDPILKSNKTWVRTVEQPAGQLLSVTDVREKKLRWLQAPVSATVPRSIDAYAKFGVYRYGKSTDVLLHYYARLLDVNSHEDLHELSRAEQMDLDIVPHDFGQQMTLTVRWHGKTVSDRMVHIRGPQGFRKNVKTDADGQVKFKIENEGRFTFRTSVEEDTQGTDNGKDYVLIRHHATLIMNLPLEK